MVEHAYLQSHHDGKGRFGITEEAALFAGTHRKSGDHMVCPDLLDSVNLEVGRQHHEANLQGQGGATTVSENKKRKIRGAGQVALILSR